MQKQHDAGVDVANDGEQGRVGFQTYIPQRMTGFGGELKRPTPPEFTEFPLFAARLQARIPRTGKVFGAPQAVAPVQYEDTSVIAQEIERAKRHAAEQQPPFAECFMTAPSPGIIATTMLNAHYDLHETYVNALAREMQKEYRAVADSGLLLQIDAPDLAMERVFLFQDKIRSGVRPRLRNPCRGPQPRTRRHPARPGAAAYLLGKLGRPACS